MQQWIAVTTCIALSACGSARRSAHSTTSPSVSNEGVYEYSATIPGYQPGKTLRVQGTLSVVGDSLFVQPDSGCVLYNPTVRHAPGAATINCGRASLNFDRRNLKSATWSGFVQVPKQRNSCVQYETAASNTSLVTQHDRRGAFGTAQRRITKTSEEAVPYNYGLFSKSTLIVDCSWRSRHANPDAPESRSGLIQVTLRQ
jgi:hypothetical protein